MVRCPNCGNENPDYSVFCGRCAADLTEAKSKLQQRDVIPQPQPSPRPVAASTSSMTLSPAATSKPAPATRKCAWCGKDVNASSYVCPFCGKNPYGPWGRDNQQESMYREQASQIDYGYGMPSRPGPSGALIAGGIFAILAGVLALGQGLLYSSVSSSFASLPGSGSLCLCGGLDALFGVFSLAAGVCALRGKNFVIAVIGSVFGMLGIGLLIGFVFGLVAVILIAVSKDDFD